MKPHALILAASLVANAILLSLLVFARDPAAKLPFLNNSAPGTTTATAHAAQGAPAGQQAEPSATALSQAIAGRDLATLRDQLRALGLPEEMVRRLVRTLLAEPYYARYRALIAQHRADKSDLLRGDSLSSGFTKDERAELRALSRDVSRQIEALFGSTSPEPDLESARYSYLPHDKADQLRQINRDYAEMRNDLNDEIGRFRIASDEQKLKLLEQERRKDIESLLSPAELLEYDLRHSATASTLRNRLGKLTVSDSEFRALFDLLRPVHDNAATQNLASLGIRANEPLTPDQIAQLKAQREARIAADEQVRLLLGDERYNEYNRAGIADYRNLQTAATRFNLAPATVEQVYGLRNAVSAETLAIANNAALTPEQKKASLAGLATQTRNQVRTALGQEIGDAYLKNSMQWLDRVANGYTVTFSPTGAGVSYKSVAPRQRPPASPAPAPTPDTSKP